MSTRNPKPAWLIAAALTALAAINFSGAVYWWFYRGFTWELGPLKISLHQWDKAWVTGLICWGLAVIVRPGPFLSERLVSLFDPWREKKGASSVRGFAMMGAAPGFALGYYLARLHEYFLPSLAHAVIAGSIAAAASSAVYYVWALAFARLPVFPLFSTKEEYRAGLRNGFHIFLWLLAVRLWSRDWEGRYFDPLGPLYIGALLGLIPVIALGFPFKVKGSLTRKRAAAAGIGVFAVLSAYGLFDYLYRTYGGEGPRDRVLFITLDTTRADRLSCYGYSRPTSPFIDSVAQKGVRFERAIAPMGTTDPSHISMFTGAYPRTTGVIDVALPINGPAASLPDYFLERGFRTAAIASRVALEPAETLGLPGFEHESTPHRSRHPIEIHAPETFRRAASWLSRHRHEDVFIWVHFFDVHMPYEPHPGFPVRFTDSKKHCKEDHWPQPDKTYSPEEIQRCNDLYDGEIAYMDDWIRKLIAYVESLEPQSERPALIVLVGDHGEALGEYLGRDFHFGFGHEGMIHESVAHIPLILSWPGVIPEGKVIGETVEVVDLASTLADYVFGATDFPTQGQNLRPIIEGKAKGRDTAFVQRWKSDRYEIKPYSGEDRYAVYKGEFKIFATPGQPVELYKPQEDLLEERDLADTQADKAAELAGELEAWQKRVPLTRPAERRRTSSNDSLEALGYINAGGGKEKPPAKKDGGEEKDKPKDD